MAWRCRLNHGHDWRHLASAMHANVLMAILAATAASTTETACRPPFGCFHWLSEFINWPRRPYNPDPQWPLDVRLEVYLFARWLPADKPVIRGRGDHRTRWIRYRRHRAGQQPCIISTGDLLRPNRLANKLKRLQAVRTKWTKQRSEPMWTAVIVHGYHTDSRRSAYVMDMKDKLMANRIGRQYEMVLVTDWGPGAFKSYPLACSNARLVANELAFILRRCLESLEGTTASRLHLIGHSLGAHLAAYVGKNFTVDGPKPIGRITGLDPAGPYFERLPALVRLDRSDADLVDVIHTNGRWVPRFSLGMSQSIGHLDFFPNGGYHQIGCWNRLRHTLIMAKIEERLLREDTCDHIRSTQLFLSSIPSGPENTACAFRAARCHSWKDFVRDQCPAKEQCRNLNGSKSHCAQMGLFAYKWAEENPGSEPTESIQFYLQTTGHSPFCQPTS